MRTPNRELAERLVDDMFTAKNGEAWEALVLMFHGALDKHQSSTAVERAAKREAFEEVEAFIARNGSVDIQSFVEKKIRELAGTL